MTENRRQRTENGDSLSSVLRRLSSVLREANIDNSDLDTRILAAHALGIDRVQLLAQSDRILTNDETHCIDTLIARRARHEPVARILSVREFWSLPFGLNEATLVPRPESETVVEAALEGFRVQGSGFRENNINPRTPNPEPRTLDLGTGSGCLLLALLHELPHATGLGVDIAPRAVEQAKKNAEQLGLTKRAEFCVSNWADGINERFDIVVCNPPYIAQKEIPALMPEVRDYDPHAALDGGEDGLTAYRLLIPQLPRLLKPNGAAIFEIGIGQAGAVHSLFEKFEFSTIETRKDLSGIERCVMAHMP